MWSGRVGRARASAIGVVKRASSGGGGKGNGSCIVLIMLSSRRRGKPVEIRERRYWGMVVSV